MENDTDITRREELNDRETEEIASVLEGARPSNRVDVDRKELRDRLLVRAIALMSIARNFGID